MGSWRRSQFNQGVHIQHLEALVEDFGKLLKCSGIGCVKKSTIWIRLRKIVYLHIVIDSELTRALEFLGLNDYNKASEDAKSCFIAINRT